ncbi:MAG: type II secretion system protein [Candidatus Bruticola sp.]
MNLICIRTSKFGFTLIELMIVIAILAVLILIMLPNMMRSRDAAKLSSCKYNLRGIAAAMESYATDNSGMYPQDMNKLVEKNSKGDAYLRTIPKCPVAGSSEPYFAGYEVISAPKNAYTICCQGNYHKIMGLDDNYPKYSAVVGLIESQKSMENDN